MTRVFARDRMCLSGNNGLADCPLFRRTRRKSLTAIVRRWEMVPQGFQGAGEGEWFNLALWWTVLECNQLGQLSRAILLYLPDNQLIECD
jgi:hypothetical protein